MANRYLDRLVWVAYAVVFFGTIMKRKVEHIYVANWFFGAFIVAVAVLHIVNSAAMPVNFMKPIQHILAYKMQWCSGMVITRSVSS